MFLQKKSEISKIRNGYMYSENIKWLEYCMSFKTYFLYITIFYTEILMRKVGLRYFYSNGKKVFKSIFRM